MDWLAAHLHEAVTLAGACFGVWAVFQRGRLLLRAEVREYAASKEDLARIEAKLDTVLELAFSPRRKRK